MHVLWNNLEAFAFGAVEGGVLAVVVVGATIVGVVEVAFELGPSKAGAAPTELL